MRSVSSETGTGLRHLFSLAQTIEPGDQQPLQAIRDRECWQRAAKQISVVVLAQQAALQDGLDQLFDEQRHAIGMIDDVAVYLTWQPLAGNPIGHGNDLRMAQAIEYNGCGIRVARPRRRELRPVGDQQQHRQISNVIDDEVEQLVRGWIHPMHVLENDERRPIAGQSSKLCDQRFQRFLSASLRTDIGYWVSPFCRDRQQGGDKLPRRIVD